jgi:hypothetical protein
MFSVKASFHSKVRQRAAIVILHNSQEISQCTLTDAPSREIPLPGMGKL